MNPHPFPISEYFANLQTKLDNQSLSSKTTIDSAISSASIIDREVSDVRTIDSSPEDQRWAERSIFSRNTVK